MFPPLYSSAKKIESDSCAVVKLALFFLCHPPLGLSAAGAAVRWVQGHTVVLFWEKGLLCCQVSVVGRDSYSIVFPPRVRASAAPFAPLTDDPLPQPNGLHPGSNLASRIWACVCSPELWLCSQDLANQTGLHRCDRLRGMLGMWRRRSGRVHPWPGAEGGRASSVSADS